MGAFSGEMQNAMITAALKKEAPSISPEYVSGGLQEEKKPAKEAAASQRVIEITGAPVTGSIVCATELNGKTGEGEAVGPLVIGNFYYVRKAAANEVELAYTKAQAESATAGEHIELTAAVKTTSKFMVITEATVAARVKTTFGSTANKKGEDGTAREVESTATQAVFWVTYFSAAASGTFAGGYPITERKMVSGDILKVTKTLGEELQ